MTDALSVCWAEYIRFQAFADRQKLNRRSWGIDEALGELLSKIENSSLDKLSCWLSELALERGRRLGTPVQIEEGLRAWLKNVATNRSKKYRSPAPLEEAKGKGYVEDAAVKIDTAEDVEFIQSNTTDNEWQVLWRIACGEGYRSLSLQLCIGVNSLKSMVWRCRRRLATLFVSAA
jgi:hypothetical protein